MPTNQQPVATGTTEARKVLGKQRQGAPRGSSPARLPLPHTAKPSGLQGSSWADLEEDQCQEDLSPLSPAGGWSDGHHGRRGPVGLFPHAIQAEPPALAQVRGLLHPPPSPPSSSPVSSIPPSPTMANSHPLSPHFSPPLYLPPPALSLPVTPPCSVSGIPTEEGWGCHAARWDLRLCPRWGDRAEQPNTLPRYWT